MKSDCACCCKGKGKDKEVSVSFCPSCKSRDVKYVFGLGNLFGVIPKMKCMDCGFDCQSFPVLTVSKEDLERAVKKIKKKVSRKKAAKKKVARRAKK